MISSPPILQPKSEARIRVCATIPEVVFAQTRSGSARISGAPTSTLTLDDLNEADEGRYSVRVYNAEESSLREEAVLHPLRPPRVEAARGSGDTVLLTVLGEPGAARVIESCRDLREWQEIATQSAFLGEWLTRGVSHPGPDAFFCRAKGVP